MLFAILSYNFLALSLEEWVIQRIPSQLLVLDNEKLVGVVTQTDLASYLRDQLLVDGTIKSISND